MAINRNNRTNRMNTLNNAGIDTSKYFNLAIDKTLPKGTTLTITIGDDGMPIITDAELKAILNKIEDDGYVKNSKLFRRWVMAQTFRMMNYPDGGYTGALNAKPYAYQWTMLENELHAMAKISKEDPEQFEVRKDFFNKAVIIAMLEDYKDKVYDYCKDSRWRMGTVYPSGIGIAHITITAIRNAGSYERMHTIIKEFNKEVKTGCPNIALPKNTKKCREWMDAYKGAGAYYTLQNMIRFHLGDTIILPDVLVCGKVGAVNRKEAEEILNNKRKEYRYEWYKLFGYFKKVVELNHFDFGYAMDKIYGNKRYF